MCTMGNPNEIRLAIVDNDDFVLMGLAAFLSRHLPNVRLAWKANTGTDALEYATDPANEADILLVDMSLEDMNRTFKEIQDSYHGWYFDVYDEGVCYDWVDVSHLFYSPLYYMGYGTSALSALDLWTMSRRDWDGAVDTYMGLLNEVTQVISRQLNVNIRKLTIETEDGIFEGKIQLWVHDVDDVKTICNNLKKIQNIKQVSRVEE